MIVLERPSITDLYIPRSGNSEACVKKGCFSKKDIMDILSNYITVDSAYTILDEIFVDYISGDNNLTELVLNAVGDVYTREQIDEIVDSLQEQIDGMDFATEQWVEDKGYIDDITLTINGQEVHNGDSVTIETQATPPATFIWIDDFPDGVAGSCWDPDTGEEIPCPQRERYSDEWIEEFYGFDDLDSYLDWYLDALGDAGCNTYVYKGEFEYDGEEYWLYQYSDQWGGGDSVKYGLLPKSITREELEENSLMTDHQNIFNDYTPFAYYLRYDGREYEVGSDMPYIIVGLK
jgi:hypothetical protein